MRCVVARSLLLVIVTTAGMSALLRGQAPDQNRPAFEVASVKDNTSGSPQSAMQWTLPDGFIATNQTLLPLISHAYQVPPFKVSDGPDWLQSARFDINIKSDHEITPDEKLRLIRGILEDRFRLQTHREMRDSRIYALVIASRDRTLGPNLKPTTFDCSAILQSRLKGDPIPSVRPGTSDPVCGATAGPREIIGKGVQMFAFADLLGEITGAPIVDGTGLTGFWDLNLSVNYEGLIGPSVASDPTLVFTTLQEQLGLRLDPRRGPVDTFVIDRIERPTPD